MRNVNVRAFIVILLAISVVVWITYASVTGGETNKPWHVIRALPTVATIDMFIFALFAKWGWRWKRFQNWLILFPDLSGTWQGFIQSTWIDPTTRDRPGPIPVILTIRQSFGSISCVMRSSEMTSHSYAEGFRIESDSQIRRLAYSYASRPNLTLGDRSAPHDGTVVLDIIGEPVSRLKGCYWTTRKTTGDIVLTFRDKKLLDEIPSDLGSHPMCGIMT